MLSNYLKIAYRNIVRNKIYSFINIAGLAIGLATCLIISLYVLDDLSFDNQQSRADRIGLFQQFPNSSSSGSPFSTLLRRQAGIEAVTQISPRRAMVSRRDLSAYESRFYLADTNLTRIFEFPMVTGSMKQALALPNQIVISERMATKYFANTSPLGQTLDSHIPQKKTFTVVGVMKNTPDNTHLPIDFVASSLNKRSFSDDDNGSYWDFTGMTYFLLSPKTNFAQIDKKLPGILKATNDPDRASWKLAVIPLRDIYLRHRLDDFVRATYAIEFVRIFSAVALCILLLACFNYLNLSSARATLRAREVGIRKAIGARRAQLVRQFLGESFIFTLIATMMALLLAQVALPFFNNFADKNLSLIPFLTSSKAGLLIGFVLLISLLTGLYPAFVLSNFNPAKVLKNYLLPHSGRAYVRRGMVVGQFVISIVMLVATIVVMYQLRYIQHKDLGYQREQVLTLDLPPLASESMKVAFQNDVKQLARVEAVTRVSLLPGTGMTMYKVSPQSVTGSPDDLAIGQLYVDSHFQSVFGIKMMEGRFFQQDNAADAQNFVVNQLAMNKYNWKLGQTIGYMDYEYKEDGTSVQVPVNGQIIGVVQDFNQLDLKTPMLPMMMLNNVSWGPLALKLQGTDLSATVPLLKKTWDKQFPNYPFEYSLLDEAFDKTYRREAQTSRVFGLFAGLSVFISCLGLLGLAAFTAEQRTKEIGIRKVMGASVSSIVALLSKDFLKLVLIALVLATPIAWYGMDTWLQDFAYRIEVTLWMFLLAGILTALVAFLTVSFQAIKAGLMNPVKSLRSD